MLLSAEGVVKICDFGLSRLYDNATSIVNPSHKSSSGYSSGGGGGGHSTDSASLTMTTRVGTPAYMAPELAQADNTFDGNANNSIDVYSYGILLWALCTSEEP